LKSVRVMISKMISVRVVSAVGSTTAELEVKTWRSSQRLAQGIVTGIGFLVGAVAALCIPLLHFILFPIVAVVGVFVTYRAFTKNFRVVGGRAHCPSCRSEFAFQTGASALPFRDHCTSCNCGVEVLELNPSAI
jgi:hypothetical protein